MRKALPILAFVFLCGIAIFISIAIPARTEQLYGPPAPWLTAPQRLQYSALLLWYDGLLTRPLNPNSDQQGFSIASGATVNEVALNLQNAGLIRDAESFRAYLIYAGFDTSIQAGDYRLSPAMSAIEIAREIQDATTSEVTFVVLPGWRMEEIAASLPTSGLTIAPEQFLAVASSPPSELSPTPEATSTEGFLFPDTYQLARNTSVNELVTTLLRNFTRNLTPDLTNGFTAQGLSTYQAVIIASIVEREAVRDDEKPLIASVYLNRLAIGMKLDADPTVQYALGYDSTSQTWWTNPLTLTDLQIDSPFNTYLYTGFPPAPISNPGIDSLQAVAYPAQTPYYFFRARCDGSGYHSFSETFEEHLANGCP